MFNSNYRYKDREPWHSEEQGEVGSSILQELKPQPLTFTPILVPYSVRGKHIYIAGKTQQGKTTLMASIIQQDIEHGAGVCVLDPKPSTTSKPNLVETILRHIPPTRQKDIVYFSAAAPFSLDIMSWETEEERQTLAADLVQTFRQLSSNSSDEGTRWPGILRFAIHTLILAKSCSFLDIYNFLVDPPKVESLFRTKILERIKDPKYHAYWNKSYPLFPNDAAVPILNRMTQHILVDPLSIMLGANKADYSIEDIIRNRKILLVDLTGAGKETGNFIGTLFVSRIQQAVFRGLDVPFHLFADEFQNFQTSAFDTILSEAGQLGLRLTLANQYVGQMEERIRKAIFGNVSTYFVFNIGSEDTSYFKDFMPEDAMGKPMRPDALAKLPEYNALYAIARRKPVFKSIPVPLPPATAEQLAFAQSVRKRTLDAYACKMTAQSHTEVNEDPPASGRTDTPPSSGVPVSHPSPARKTGRYQPPRGAEKPEPPPSGGKKP